MLYNTPLVPLYFGEKDRLEKCPSRPMNKLILVINKLA